MVHLKPAYLSRETKYDFFSCFCSDGCVFLSLCYQNKLLVSSLLYLYTIFYENLLPSHVIGYIILRSVMKKIYIDSPLVLVTISHHNFLRCTLILSSHLLLVSMWALPFRFQRLHPGAQQARIIK
jgi:hypothetical protein